MNKIIKRSIIILFTLFLLGVLSYLMFNQRISISRYTISNSNITSDFANYKIVHLSDLHYKYFKNNELVKAIKSENPNLIVMTGDMIDKNNTDYSNTEQLFKSIVSLAPVYCVSGNHEVASNSIKDNMSALYTKYKITELNNQSVQITKGNSSITLYGIRYTGSNSEANYNKLLEERLEPADTDCFSILLNHRADTFDSISQYGYSLVLSGHSHGGIIRIPFIGGLLGNDGAFFPKYDAGAFKKHGSVMIASRGLGKSNWIPRTFNRPDLVSITLK